MNHHPANHGRVMVTAWVSPEDRELAREMASRANVPVSEWVQVAIGRFAVELVRRERELKGGAR